MVAIHPAPPAVSAFPASFQTETRDMLYRSTATGCAYRAALLAGGSSRRHLSFRGRVLFGFQPGIDSFAAPA